MQQTSSFNEYTKVFKNFMLELGDRALDKDVLIFAYINGLKEDL